MVSNPRPDEVATLVVSPKNAALLLDVGVTRLYELINATEIESFRAGKSRKVVVASIKAYVARQIAAEATKPRSGWTDRATKARLDKKMSGERAARPSRHIPDSVQPACSPKRATAKKRIAAKPHIG
jgi:hypothetical protein